MGVPRFHCAVPLDPTQVGAEIALPDAVAHHAVRVLRLAEGDALVLFDGTGGEYRGTLAAVDRHGARVRVDGFDPVDRESTLAVTLVQAIIAADAMEIALRKAVELGAAAVVPVFAARSQGSPAGDKAGKRLAHWRQIAVAACEQCGRNHVPPVASPTTFAEWLQRFDAASAPALMLVPGGGRSLAAAAAVVAPRSVLIGPEGGWTDEEIARANASGVATVHLGRRVLRSETATIAALATINAIAGDAR
jgi:16S rRNA (uracil1498-N3)-methyltransferase